jgi:hypothetical protein
MVTLNITEDTPPLRSSTKFEHSSFDDAVSPLALLMAALLPTIIVWLCFALL